MQRKFGKYTADKKLGQGAMGQVYYGMHPNLDIPIAIKTLSAKLAFDKSYIERFIREAKIAAKIRHENAVMIYDADCQDDTYFIVMEYISGGDLKERMAATGIMAEEKALETVKAVASALKTAANYDIIHRDIKPANIMISEEGVPKLADLGIAKRITEDSESTMAGAIIGTPLYLAPEQAENSTNVDARTDIYSLGCTLYEMLSGAPPYTGNSPLAIMMKHSRDPVPDIKNDQVSKQTRALCRRMMAKKPDDRPADANELITEIDKILHRQKPEIKVSKKNMLIAGGLVAAVVILALVIALMPKGDRSTEPESDLVNSPSEVPEENFAVKGLGIEMIYNKPGSFQMGQQPGEPNSKADETLHRVSITEGFYLSKFEVTVKAWKEFIKDTAYLTEPERDNGAARYNDRGTWTRFAKGVNWKTINLSDSDVISTITRNDCLKFCDWLTLREQKSGRLSEAWKYTLPTEAQWEYACRAGSSTTYANEMTLNELGFYRQNSNFQAQKPGQKKPNAWGYYDMHGNLWEFCLDQSQGNGWDEVKTNTYTDGATDPLSNTGNKFIFRGGSYPDNAEMCRAASRGHGPEDYASNNHGFRLCLSKKP